MMKSQLFESDRVEFVKDVLAGRAIDGVTIDDFAPELDNEVAAGGPYDETKDPEVIHESLMESIRLREESRDARIASYVKSLSDISQASFEDFMNTDFSRDNDTEKTFKGAVSLFRRRPEELDKYAGGTDSKSYSAGGESKTKGKAAAAKAKGPYDEDRPDTWEANSKTAGFSSVLGGASLKGSAEEIFAAVVGTVRNLILGYAELPHACIYGDPGVGKSVTRKTKITINVEDNIAEELEDYLKTLK